MGAASEEATATPPLGGKQPLWLRSGLHETRPPGWQPWLGYRLGLTAGRLLTGGLEGDDGQQGWVNNVDTREKGRL